MLRHHVATNISSKVVSQFTNDSVPMNQPLRYTLLQYSCLLVNFCGLLSPLILCLCYLYSVKNGNSLSPPSLLKCRLVLWGHKPPRTKMGSKNHSAVLQSCQLHTPIYWFSFTPSKRTLCHLRRSTNTDIHSKQENPIYCFSKLTEWHSWRVVVIWHSLLRPAVDKIGQ